MIEPSIRERIYSRALGRTINDLHDESEHIRLTIKTGKVYGDIETIDTRIIQLALGDAFHADGSGE